ncbi:MAG: YoaK family protein [Fusobacteria bacterium]|nr:YoaK family protein [Fusobacteriota bacterium]
MQKNIWRLISEDRGLQSNLCLAFASGMIEAVSFILCLHIFVAFMTGTAVSAISSLAINGITTHTVLSIWSMIMTTLGGFVGALLARIYMDIIKSPNKVFSKMIGIEVYLLLVATIIGMYSSVFHYSQNISIQVIIVTILSFLMGYHYNHVGSSIFNVSFKTHFMTGNCWMLLNTFFKKRIFSKELNAKQMYEINMRMFYVFFIEVFFFLGIALSALLSKYLNFSVLLFPFLIFWMAKVILCRGLNGDS